VTSDDRTMPQRTKLPRPTGKTSRLKGAPIS
jgi:hypothetical protein